MQVKTPRIWTKDDVRVVVSIAVDCLPHFENYLGEISQEQKLQVVMVLIGFFAVVEIKLTDENDTRNLRSRISKLAHEVLTEPPYV